MKYTRSYEVCGKIVTESVDIDGHDLKRLDEARNLIIAAAGIRPAPIIEGLEHMAVTAAGGFRTSFDVPGIDLTSVGVLVVNGKSFGAMLQ